MKRKIVAILFCVAMLAGCANKSNQMLEPVSIVLEDGTISLNNLYFSDGKNTIHNLKDEKAFDSFKKIISNKSNMNGSIGDNDFSSFEIKSKNETEISYVSFTEDKQVFQITISPNYAAPEGMEPSNELTIAGIHLLDSYDDVVSTLGKPSQEDKDENGNVSTVIYNETEYSFLYISFKDNLVNYIAVQFN